jgi:serine/threonine protein kinase
MDEYIEKIWNTDVILPAFTKLTESSDDSLMNSEKCDYGQPYMSIDFTIADPGLSDLLFNGTICSTLDIVHVDENSTPDQIKLRDSRDKVIADMIFLNKGGYGKIYKCTHPKNTVCKMMRSADAGKPEMENCFISEAFIHSILSGDERATDICPRVLGIKIERRVLRTPLLFLEKMDGPLNEFSKFSGKIFKEVMLQFADILQYLQEKYKFIHGDLKINNICYRKTGFRTYKFVFVDLGMSILSFKGCEISTNAFIKRGMLKDVMFPNSGDLSLLLVSLYDFFRDSRDIIAELLMFPGEEKPLIEKYRIIKNTREVYTVCYGCHNPLTTPQNIIKYHS